MCQFGVETDPVAVLEGWAGDIFAPMPVIDPAAVADTERKFSAAPPDCVLDKSGGIGRERELNARAPTCGANPSQTV